MAASSFRDGFVLDYLTVFRSRLASVKLVLREVGFAHISDRVLTRSLRRTLESRVSVSLSERPDLVDYLVEKGFVSKRKTDRGRYPELVVQRGSSGWELSDPSGSRLDQIEAYEVDLWFADGRVGSTVGIPTPDNVEEIVDFARQLGVITPSRNVLTTVGQLIQSFDVAGDNPFVLGPEAVVLLRLVLERDTLVLRPLVSFLLESGWGTMERDDVAMALPDLVWQAIEGAERLHLPRPAIREAKKFHALLENTADKRRSQSRAPGVLEHRTAPRLEWLVDFGALTKLGLARNAFKYRVSERAAALLDVLQLVEASSGDPDVIDDAAVEYWRGEPGNSNPAGADVRRALLDAYASVRRPVGPAPIRELCLAAALRNAREGLSPARAREALLQMGAEGLATLSGGRFRREPEFVQLKSNPV